LSYTRPRFEEDDRDRQYSASGIPTTNSAVQRMMAISGRLPRQRSRQHLSHTRAFSQDEGMSVCIDIPEHVSILMSPNEEEPPDPFWLERVYAFIAENSPQEAHAESSRIASHGSKIYPTQRTHSQSCVHACSDSLSLDLSEPPMHMLPLSHFQPLWRLSKQASSVFIFTLWVEWKRICGPPNQAPCHRRLTTWCSLPDENTTTTQLFIGTPPCLPLNIYNIQY